MLIEKEWLSFGHKFADRCGHTTTSDGKEQSPVFLQVCSRLRVFLCENSLDELRLDLVYWSRLAVNSNLSDCIRIQRTISHLSAWSFSFVSVWQFYWQLWERPTWPGVGSQPFERFARTLSLLLLGSRNERTRSGTTSYRMSTISRILSFAHSRATPTMFSCRRSPHKHWGKQRKTTFKWTLAFYSLDSGWACIIASTVPCYRNRIL